MSKKKALVICPGRGTYNRDELGYLQRHHADKGDFIAMIDTAREQAGQEIISDLDAREAYSPSDHTRGDNASALIYACAYADFMSIDREKYDVVAVTGNSMGWYIALACASAVSSESAMQIINTMGTLMHENQSGGQVIYPFVDENWREIAGKRADLYGLAEEIEGLYVSIALGGMVVFAGSDNALKTLKTRLPKQDIYPLSLPNHGAYHTPMMAEISEMGFDALGQELFGVPEVPLIDGRGNIWTPYSSDAERLREYTLGHQVVKTYDFTSAVQVGAKEFAPDCIIILGPGGTLGGVVSQSLIDINWLKLDSKESFLARQKSEPFVLSMGREDQRGLVSG